MSRHLIVVIALCLSACSSLRPWINEPLESTPTIDATALAQRDGSALFALTLSGGGARAAAFGYGVMQELRETPCCWVDKTSNVLDAVDIVSGVSGGSIVAAYYAAYGADKLDGFERDFLRQGFQDGLIDNLFSMGALYDLTSPFYGRGHLLERRLDQLYAGMTYGDVMRRPRHPQLVVTATDMSLGTGFDFTAQQFDLICSKLENVPLSFAVAASSSVPLVLSPLTLRNYADRCPKPPDPRPSNTAITSDYRTRMYEAQRQSYVDAKSRPFIHLVDGGLSDNLGVRHLLDRAIGGGLNAAFDEIQIKPGSVKRLVIITVNAERAPARRIDEFATVPSATEVVDALLFGAGNRATIETQEFLADAARAWQDSVGKSQQGGVSSFAPDARIFLVQVNLRDAPEGERRTRLLQVPTAFSISDDEVTSLIAAGREVLRSSKSFQALRESMAATAP
ncbi:patatin-like phospholipase family protein [soil metagenome]